MELAYQLKIDVKKREEEIVELDTEVKIKVNQLIYITSYITNCGYTIFRSKSVLNCRSN